MKLQSSSFSEVAGFYLLTKTTEFLPVGIYMFKVNNRNIRTLVIGVFLVSLLLTLNIFYTLF